MKNNHTKDKIEIVKNHPVFKYGTLITSEVLSLDTLGRGKRKLICHISDVRGDSFERIESDEMESNSKLITEAFNVANETGKMPRQLADENKELLEALITAEDTLRKLNINAVCDNTLMLVSNVIKKATK